ETISLHRHRFKAFIWYLDLYQPSYVADTLLSADVTTLPAAIIPPLPAPVALFHPSYYRDVVQSDVCNAGGPLQVHYDIQGAIYPSFGHLKVIREDLRQRLQPRQIALACVFKRAMGHYGRPRTISTQNMRASKATECSPRHREQQRHALPPRLGSMFYDLRFT
ncbi:hypothetical protein CMEL01_08296, partial [Colletotrichum melonis]